MQATTKPDKPGYTRVEVRGVVRAKGSQRHHVSSKYRPKIGNLCQCAGGYWDFNKVFPTDTRSNDEDKKDWDPSVIQVPSKGQGTAQIDSPLRE